MSNANPPFEAAQPPTTMVAMDGTQHIMPALRRALALFSANIAILVLGLGCLGHIHYRLDALAALRWHAAAVAVIALAAALWPRRSMLGVVAACVVAAGGPVIWAHMAMEPFAAGPYPAAASSAPPSGLRVMTFNVWDQADNTEAVRDVIAAAAPDVVMLVEVSPPKRALLEHLRPLYPHQVSCADRWPCSMAVLSRRPFEAHGIFEPSATMPATAWGRIAASDDGMPITFIAVHIYRPTRGPRLHLAHMRGLGELVRSVRGHVVVGGDFNAPDWAAAMTQLRRETGLQAMSRALPTWPAWPVVAPQFAFDHVLVSRGLRLDDVGLGGAGSSDHLPVVGTVRTIGARPAGS